MTPEHTPETHEGERLSGKPAPASDSHLESQMTKIEDSASALPSQGEGHARRAILGLGGLAAAVVVLPSKAKASDPDASLHELWERFVDTTNRAKYAEKVAAEAYRRAEASHPSKPEALRRVAGDWGYWDFTIKRGEFYDAQHVGRYRVDLGHGVIGAGYSTSVQAEFRRRAREVVDAWDAYRADCNRVDASLACDVLSDQAEQLFNAAYALENEILETRALTPAGWQVKARLASLYAADATETWEAKVLQSLLADMVGGEA